MVALAGAAASAATMVVRGRWPRRGRRSGSSPRSTCGQRTKPSFDAFRQGETAFLLHPSRRRLSAGSPKSRKSVGTENTFSPDLTSLDDMTAEIDPLAEKVWHYCDTTGVLGRTVTLKSKVRGLPGHHPKSIAPCADLGPLHIGVNHRRVARGSVPDPERSSSPWRVALFAVRRRGRDRYANHSGAVSDPRAET